MFTRNRIIIAALLGTWILALAIVYLHKDKVQLVATPPESLAQWYKPENKRHVWLHTMFNLRREMQAVKYYSESGQTELLADWTDRLSEHYQKIGEMVPEWQKRLNIDAVTRIESAQQSNQLNDIPEALVELQESCDSCHDRYRAVTALLYRAPDFSAWNEAPTFALTESMKTLNQQINTIKIAAEAGEQDRALTALSSLRNGMNDLGSQCVDCHEHTPKDYPNQAVSLALDDLQSKLETGDSKQQAKSLGTLAVTACAQCHGTHRISADSRNLLQKEVGLLELLKH